LPAYDGFLMRSARVQTMLDEARIAIALERYRMAHGGYPDSLALLVPQLLPALPHDLVTGGPMVYRREGDAGYLLYAIGWNGNDNGGIVEMNAQTPTNADVRNGDWAWRWPAR
jgi:hypothetical protein